MSTTVTMMMSFDEDGMVLTTKLLCVRFHSIWRSNASSDLAPIEWRHGEKNWSRDLDGYHNSRCCLAVNVNDATILMVMAQQCASHSRPSRLILRLNANHHRPLCLLLSPLCVVDFVTVIALPSLVGCCCCCCCYYKNTPTISGSHQWWWLIGGRWQQGVYTASHRCHEEWVAGSCSTKWFGSVLRI